MRVLVSLVVLAAAPLATAVAQSRNGGPSCLSPSNGNHYGWEKQAQQSKPTPPGRNVRPAFGCSSSGDSTASGGGSGSGGDTTPPPPPPPPSNQISGQVFVDGAVEPNVTIDLTGAASASVVTDANGNYAFTGLPDGTYLVCEEVPSGQFETSPIDPSNPICPTGSGWGFTLTGTNAGLVNFSNSMN